MFLLKKIKCYLTYLYTAPPLRIQNVGASHFTEDFMERIYALSKFSFSMCMQVCVHMCKGTMCVYACGD